MFPTTNCHFLLAIPNCGFCQVALTVGNKENRYLDVFHRDLIHRALESWSRAPQGEKSSVRILGRELRRGLQVVSDMNLGHAWPKLVATSQLQELQAIDPFPQRCPRLFLRDLNASSNACSHQDDFADRHTSFLTLNHSTVEGVEGSNEEWLGNPLCEADHFYPHSVYIIYIYTYINMEMSYTAPKCSRV